MNIMQFVEALKLKLQINFFQLRIAWWDVNIYMKKDFKKIIEASHQTDRSLFNVVCTERLEAEFPLRHMWCKQPYTHIFERTFFRGRKYSFCHSNVDRVVLYKHSTHIYLWHGTLHTGCLPKLIIITMNSKQKIPRYKEKSLNLIIRNNSFSCAAINSFD